VAVLWWMLWVLWWMLWVLWWMLRVLWWMLWVLWWLLRVLWWRCSDVFAAVVFCVAGTILSAELSLHVINLVICTHRFELELELVADYFPVSINVFGSGIRMVED
jgi:hypothetical protein